MTIRTAVVCPCTPLLVPQVCGSRPDMSWLRRLCLDAVESMLTDEIDHVAVLGPPAGQWDSRAGGSFAGYGVDLHVGGPVSELTGEHVLGAWILDTAGWAGSRSYTGGPVVEEGDTALLIMADGSAKRDHTAPGYFDTRAAEFDTAVAHALRDGAGHELAAVDSHQAAELWSNAARPLQELGRITAGRDVSAELLYHDAPFGVGYWLAVWEFNDG